MKHFLEFDVLFEKIFFSLGVLFGIIVGVALGHFLIRNAFELFDRLIAVF
ncbi:hypothetical protein [Rheinheimera soli]|nr:hypothetical protein [Rheinheimera soli]